MGLEHVEQVSAAGTYWPLLTGPTASGKSSVAMAIAARANGEIISCDAMQVYRHMDIGTAKPSLAARQQVPHHLVDYVDLDVRYTVKQWYDDAVTVIDAVAARGKLPVAVGGTPQYVTALMEGHRPGRLPEDLAYRETLRARADADGEAGWLRLHEALRRFDPRKADKLHPNDHRRVLRAHEVYHLTGRSQTDWEAHQAAAASPRYPFRAYAIAWPRDALYARINARVDRMMEAGLADEVASLRDAGEAASRTAVQAIGYKELIPWLDGKISRASAIDDLKRTTRRYAKRQLSWYRHKPWLTWLDPAPPDQLAEMILRDLSDTSASSDHLGGR